MLDTLKPDEQDGQCLHEAWFQIFPPNFLADNLRPPNTTWVGEEKMNLKSAIFKEQWGIWPVGKHIPLELPWQVQN